MEELIAYTYTDPGLTPGSYPTTSPNVTDDPAFKPTYTQEYAGYQWRWAINYLDCNNPSHCVGYVGNSLTTVANPPTYTTNYKQIDLTITGPQGATYRVTSAVTARY
jgi:hypothetical protein